MSKVIENLERQQLRKGIPGFDPGDRVKVHFQVVEGTRRRCPSITWKCTRTVSPALNRGRSLRSWRCSMLSMLVLMGKGRPRAGGQW